MIHERPERNDGTPPTPEQLAAFADGELTATERSAMEDWLANHPAAVAEVECCRRVKDLMRQTAPTPPEPRAWAAVRAGIEARLTQPRRRSFPVFRIAAGLVGTAAAAVLVVFLGRGIMAPTVKSEVFPVADAGDVMILSMDPGDAAALVVGKPPAVEPIVLATAEEVTLVSAEPYHADGVTPDMWTGQGAAPMIVPFGNADDREK